MKRFFKTLGICAIALPCALLFTACGSNSKETKVDISGKYETVAQADALNYINDAKINENFDLSSIKFTVTADVSMAGQSAQSKGYGYMKVTQDNQIQVSTESYADGKLQAAMYIVENYLYMDVAGQKVKTPLNMETPGDMPEGVTIPTADMIDALISPDSTFITCEKSVTGNNTKFHFVVNSPAIMGTAIDTSLWLVFTNDMLSGVQIEFNTEQEGMSMHMKMAIEQFTGTISFPSFDDYMEVPSTVAA